MNTNDKIAWLRYWLRFHGDYTITLDLWGMYGTIELKIYYNSEIIAWYRGVHLEKRLDQAIAWCNTWKDERMN